MKSLIISIVGSGCADATCFPSQRRDHLKHARHFILAACLAFGGSHLSAQPGGTVNFANTSTSRITNSLTGQAATTNDGIRAALYWAPLGSSSFVQIGSPVNVGVPLPGLFIGGTRATGLATPGGGLAQFQVRAWEGAFATYEEAVQQSGVLRGESGIVEVPTGNPGGAPPTPPGSLAAGGLQGFTLLPDSTLPPTLLSGPDSQTNNAGTDATFTAAALDGTPPFTYQWSKGVVQLANDVNISGADTDTLTVSGVLKADEGSYHVRISNAAGYVDSPNGVLTVVEPLINLQPVDQIVDVGSNSTFVVDASGTALQFQWRLKRGTNDALNLPGEINNCLVVHGVTTANDFDQYSVVVGNQYGMSTSSVATLIVNRGADVRPPTVRLDAKRADVAAGQIAVTGSAVDDKRIASASIRVNAGNWQPLPLTITPATKGKIGYFTNLLTLAAGTNTLEIRAVDAASLASAVTSAKYFRQVPATLTLVTNGSGSITTSASAPYYVGRNYTFAAVPGAGNLFSNWMSAVVGVTNFPTTAATYTFAMPSNLFLMANIITNRFIGVQGAYNGLFSDPAGVAHQSAGFFTLKVTSKLAFTCKLYLDGQSVSGSGVLNQSGFGTLKKAIYRKGKPYLSLNPQLTWDGSDRVTGTVSNCVPGGWVADMLGDKDVYGKQVDPLVAAQIPTNWTGPASGQKFTMVIDPGANAATQPGGCGYACVSLATNGQPKVQGNLGDGHKFKPVTTVVSKHGDWPLYASMYKTDYQYTDLKGVLQNTTIYQGSIIGWMRFTNHAIAGDVTNRDLLDSSLVWSKTGWTNGFYNDGFTNQLSVHAAPYFYQDTVTNTLYIVGQAAIELQDGNLGDGGFVNSFTNFGFINTQNDFVIAAPNLGGMKLSVDKLSGQLRGSFYHPNNVTTTRPTKIWGAVLQDENVARGYFIGTNQTGSVRVRQN